MTTQITRRSALKAAASLLGGAIAIDSLAGDALAAKKNPRWKTSIDRGLKWLGRSQSQMGHWAVSSYPTAMASLAGTALTCSGSTTTQGPFAKNIRRAVDFLIDMGARRVGGKLVPRHDGLIGDPYRDGRYTYGHGFAMLFLSQVLGEEEDEDRREELIDVLEAAVRFSALAQTKSGGWGYVSAKDGNDFDEGSTTITQVQGLRGCRNAGITVPKEIIDKAVKYIYSCQNQDGGISYSSKNRGSSRQAITAAALASLFNAGDYDSEKAKKMLAYCKQHVYPVGNARTSFGHWHYTYLYYAQVVYRQGGKEWETFRDKLYQRIVDAQAASGSWTTGSVGPVYVTSCNLIMLQLDNGYLPIYQR